jgi:glutaminase
MGPACHSGQAQSPASAQRTDGQQPAGGAQEAQRAEQTAAGVGAERESRPRAPAPTGNEFRDALSSAHSQFRNVKEGKNADYIPVLAEVDPNLYGIALVTAEGAVYEVGNSRDEFSIQSVSKVFTLARLLQTLGPDAVQERIGVNATGMPFNSIVAIEMHAEEHPAVNPFVNAGAIASVDALPAQDADAKWSEILGTYGRFAGRELSVNQEVYRSESETNTRNRAIATLLQAYGVLRNDPAVALDLYTRQCSVSVNARDLAVMGATLANGGVNPVTRERVVSEAVVPRVLAVMATAGLYETTGAWMFQVGAPAKSGVGGGIVAVVPGQFAIGTFSPPLDEAGNSVRGQRAINHIVERLNANVFAVRPQSATPAAALGGSEEDIGQMGTGQSGGGHSGVGQLGRSQPSEKRAGEKVEGAGPGARTHAP